MEPKALTAEFREFLKSLNDHGVEYLLIGGHAVAFQGYVRPTQDMDVWIS
jgi:predicted nucleotidyltransferase